MNLKNIIGHYLRADKPAGIVACAGFTERNNNWLFLSIIAGRRCGVIGRDNEVGGGGNARRNVCRTVESSRSPDFLPIQPLITRSFRQFFSGRGVTATRFNSAYIHVHGPAEGPEAGSCVHAWERTEERCLLLLVAQ